MRWYSAACAALPGLLIRSPVHSVKRRLQPVRGGDGEIEIHSFMREPSFFAYVPNCDIRMRVCAARVPANARARQKKSDDHGFNW